MKTNIKLLFLSIIVLLTFSSLSHANDETNQEQFIVVLDAGHGGKDPGNLGNHYKEKNIALNVVLAVGAQLEKNPNIKVIYTRKTDVFLELYERSAIANEADADLFVSVHCNSHGSSAYGTETFVLGTANTKRNFEIAKRENEVIFLEDNYKENYAGFDPNSPESIIGLTLVQEEYVDQSILLASKIEENFVNKLKRKSRGIKQASLWVIHNTYMPSVLVELGFLTNKKEGAYLNSKKGQTHMASSITSAILDYKNSLYQDDLSMFVEEEIPTKDEAVVYKSVKFQVQIAAGTKALDPKPYNFKGLDDITRLKNGDIYKYFYGKTSNFNEAKRLKAEAKSKGFESSFIVAFKNGKKIALSEALKSESN